jgi:hypothetical protein
MQHKRTSDHAILITKERKLQKHMLSADTAAAVTNGVYAAARAAVLSTNALAQQLLLPQAYQDLVEALRVEGVVGNLCMDRPAHQQPACARC